MLAGFMIMISLVSCLPSSKSDDLEAKENLDIQKFLSDHDTITFEKKTSGLYYYSYLEGTGPQVETHDTAYVFYSMHYISGQLYDTNLGTKDTIIFPVNEGKLIPGFEEGVSYMREGGIAILVVPSSLAFGTSGTNYISPFTPFIFQVDLVKLKKH
jgi:FKBP-type peptidyl-prolyl cis-trans isomerase